MKTVCLFDIDGTLLNSGGAGQHAMEQALAEVFGVSGPYHEIPAAGRTDWAITRDLFAFHNLNVTEEQWQRFLAAYLAHLPVSMRTMNGVVLPGVLNLLQELSSRDDVVLGLLTGNLEVGARLKLRHFDIHHFFHFGGYGDVHLHRDDVARLAHAAANKHLQGNLIPDRVWVIGDTPADVQCGRAIGAKVLAVSTGIHSIEQLRATEPDALWESLADHSAVLCTLLG